MKALDTNVVIRLLVADDPAQAVLAEAQITVPVLISLTVLLETAWVLASRYGLVREATATVLLNFIDQPTITIEEPMLVRWAIERFRSGADFADMIHLVAARAGSAFVTFDRAMGREAGTDSPVPVELLG